MLTPQEKIVTIAETTQRQFNESDQILNAMLSDSNIDSDYNNEIKGIARQMMNVAIQQHEERTVLYQILQKEN